MPNDCGTRNGFDRSPLARILSVSELVEDPISFSCAEQRLHSYPHLYQSFAAVKEVCCSCLPTPGYKDLIKS
jgi:hypothetical protein